MKIFGISFTTKKELKQKVLDLSRECETLREFFPFTLGQTVYDVALKNELGRYTKTKPSREHSLITAVIVSEKNYFSLVKRFYNNDVFFTEEDAKSFLDEICK